MHAASSAPAVTACVGALFAVTACTSLSDVLVEPEGETITSEDGAAVMLTVTLTQQPREPVTVRAVSSKPAEASVSSAVRFDATNWTEPQSIRVTGVDDAQRDGDSAYEITVVASNGYQEAVVAELDFINRDNDNAQLVGLGDLPGGDNASHASALDAAGEVAVGWSRGPSGDEAVRWTVAEGLRGLGGDESQAHSVSPDGSWTAGTLAQPTFDTGRGAVLWPADGTLQAVAPIVGGNGTPLFWMIDAAAVQNNGDAYGSCLQNGAYGVPLKCGFQSPDNLWMLGGGGRIFAVDETGDFAGTELRDPRQPAFVSMAEFRENRLGYPAGSGCWKPPPPTSCSSEARAFSAGGAVVVGTARGPLATGDPSKFIDMAFVYTQEENMQRLPDLDGGEQDSGAYAVDASGRVIGGFATDASGRRAVVWVDRSARALQDVLSEAGASVTGWSLEDVRGISADGRTFVGNAHNPAGDPEAFWARLPSPL